MDAHDARPRLPFSARDLQRRGDEIRAARSVQSAYHPSYDFIRIRRSPAHSAAEFTDFVRDARSQFSTLASQREGASLLSQLDQNARARRQDNQALPEWRRRPDLSVHVFDSAADHNGGGQQRSIGPRGAEFRPAVGAGSDVFIRRVGVAEAERGQQYLPAFISTGHEFVHALRAQRGIQSESRLEEEFETVGGIFRSPSPQGITENSLRAEHGLPRRTRY